MMQLNEHPSPKWTLLLAFIFMELLCGMEFDLFVPSFPTLQHQFGLSVSAVEALLSEIGRAHV